MVGYRKFLNLTLQRWKRFVIVQNINPLVPKSLLEQHFSKTGPIERVHLIHNPGNGCYMRKALVLMKSQLSAARIIRKRHHEVSTDEFVTTVEYRGSVKKYKHGRFKLFVELWMPIWRQNISEGRFKTGHYLIHELVKAYRGCMFTSIRLHVTSEQKFYNGLATVRFEFENERTKVLEIAERLLNARALWVDTKAVGYNQEECINMVGQTPEEGNVDWNADWN